LLSLSFVVELTSLFRLHYSVFNVQFQLTHQWILINSLTLFAILYFVLSVCIRQQSCDYFLPHSDPLNFRSGQPVISAVSSPTSFILHYQKLKSTCFLKSDLQFVTLFFSKIFKVQLMCYHYISALRWCPSVLQRLPLAPSVNHFLYAFNFNAFLHYKIKKNKNQVPCLTFFYLFLKKACFTHKY